MDTEGLILHVTMDRHAWRFGEWRELVNEVQERSLESGLIGVIDEVIRRLAANGVAEDGGYEYLANAREAWMDVGHEDDAQPLDEWVAKVDSIVLGLVEALDADAENLPELLEQALSGSLWERQVERMADRVKTRHMNILAARGRLIWNETTAIQRGGHFAMGVGLETGLQVDEIADALADDLDQADVAALHGDLNGLRGALVRLAAQMLNIRPFAPDALGEAWAEVLREWIGGAALSVIGSEHVGLIEDAFTYRLVWALEAVRVRRLTRGWDA